jgi:hypothetical protein
MSTEIGLTEFIAQIKRELIDEPAGGKGIPLLMVDNVELELQVLTSRDGKGGIKVNVMAVSGEIGAGARRDDTHKVRITLTPIQSHAERVEALRRTDAWQRIADRQGALDKGDQSSNLRNQ